MSSLIFDPASYTVTCGSDSIGLLAKEFALLQFLYDHRNQAFTREQLLDRVWLLEYPVERTVDDHIYRLRRKLRHWPHIAINTVRGYGYSLTVRDRRAVGNPSVQDPEVQEAMRELFKKYHLLGQGRSLLALADRQEVLGFEVDEFYTLYVHFIQGDIPWFLEENGIPFREKLYWMLLMYRGMALRREEVLSFLQLCERVLALHILPDRQQREMEILNILDVYADAGRPGEAINRFEKTRQTVESDGLSGFVIPVAIMEMYVQVVAGQSSEAERASGRIERLLQGSPYLREIGRYHIVKGLYLLTQGQRQVGADLIDEGLEVLQASMHVPMLLGAVCQIVLFLQERLPDTPRLEQKYRAFYDALDKEFGLSRYRTDLKEVIQKAIFP